jgi:hypothetical protein
MKAPDSELGPRPRDGPAKAGHYELSPRDGPAKAGHYGLSPLPSTPSDSRGVRPEA